MKQFTLIILLLFIVAAAQANPKKNRRQLQKYMKRNNIHWQDKRRTVTGKHNYYNPGWGYSSTCATYPSLPTKESTFKRHVWWRPAN